MLPCVSPDAVIGQVANSVIPQGSAVITCKQVAPLGIGVAVTNTGKLRLPVLGSPAGELSSISETEGFTDGKDR